MRDWSPDTDGEHDDAHDHGEPGTGPAGVARVMTILPIALRLVPTPHPRAPEGHTVFRAIGTIAGADAEADDPDLGHGGESADDTDGVSRAPHDEDRTSSDELPVLAQGSLPSAMFDAVQRLGLFAEPVPLLLTVHEHEGGVRGVLAAIVPARQVERIERESRAAEEPWLASVAAGPEGNDYGHPDDDADEAHVPFALGVILRFPEDRKHPVALDDEAVDLLATILSGRAMDADRKRVENLLKSL